MTIQVNKHLSKQFQTKLKMIYLRLYCTTALSLNRVEHTAETLIPLISVFSQLSIRLRYRMPPQSGTHVAWHSQTNCPIRIRPRSDQSSPTKNVNVFPLRLQNMSMFTRIIESAVVCMPGQ